MPVPTTLSHSVIVDAHATLPQTQPQVDDQEEMDQEDLNPLNQEDDGIVETDHAPRFNAMEEHEALNLPSINLLEKPCDLFHFAWSHHRFWNIFCGKSYLKELLFVRAQKDWL